MSILAIMFPLLCAADELANCSRGATHGNGNCPSLTLSKREATNIAKMQPPPNTATARPPALEPKLLPNGALKVVAKVSAHGLSEQLLLASNALTSAECEGWISFAEMRGLVSTRPKDGRPEPNTAYRDNYRLQIHDADVAASMWASGLGSAIVAAIPSHGDGRKPVGFNDNLRLYRYDAGLRFEKHYDETVRDSMGRQTFYTVLFYLSECGGGETVFYSEHGGKLTASIKPRVGSMVLHRHGVGCWQHEGLPVTSGTKYILRTDVVFA